MRAMGYRLCAAALGIVFCLLTGCTSSAQGPRNADTSSLLVLNGIDGPGPWYNTLIDGLRDGHAADRVEMVNWGGPFLVWPNLWSSLIHERAEHRLASRIAECRRLSPAGRITLVGHSAGCGVILDALEHLPPETKVETVILLAACVGKDRDLAPALSHVSGMMHVFYSKRDQLLLGMSTLVTGTYDRAWTTSGGYQGFSNTDALPPELQQRLQQHRYDPAWRKLGHEGGHFGYRERRFAAAILAPLAAHPTTMPTATANLTPPHPAGTSLQ